MPWRSSSVDDRHRRLGLRDDRPDAGDDPADDDPLAVERLVPEVAGVGRHEPADLLGDLAHRMVRQVEPEQLLLPAEPLADRRPRSPSGAAPRAPPRLGREVEEASLARCPVALVGLGGGERVVEAEEELGRVAEARSAPRP